VRLSDGERAGQTAPTTLLPLRMAGKRLGVHMDPPQPGQHTQELLRSLGYVDDSIAALRDSQAIAGWALAAPNVNIDEPGRLRQPVLQVHALPPPTLWLFVAAVGDKLGHPMRLAGVAETCSPRGTPSPVTWAPAIYWQALRD